jgi:hypothetical protein
VIEGRFLGGDGLTTVLALVAIAREHIGATERRTSATDANILEESHNRGRFYRYRYRMNMVVVFVDNFDLAHEAHRYRPLPRNDTQRLEA